MANKYHGNVPRPDAPKKGKGPSNGMSTSSAPTGMTYRTYPWKDMGPHQPKRSTGGKKKLDKAYVVAKGL